MALGFQTNHVRVPLEINKTVAVILAGGRGSRLQELTHTCPKPGLDFGGKFKIIDFALSNCINSGVRRVAVLTQYHSQVILGHLSRGWNFLKGEFNEFLDVLPAQETLSGGQWYTGTAHALYTNLPRLREYGARHVLVLAGDHIYKMNYSIFLEEHLASGADVTIACHEVPSHEATGFGVMQTDATGRVLRFLEKPKRPPSMPGKPGVCLASMGIYLFSAPFLFSLLEEDAANPHSSHDFGKDIMPRLADKGLALAHSFARSCVSGTRHNPIYWKDVGTLDAFWEANLDLTRIEPELNMYDFDWPIYTYQGQLPSAKFVFANKSRSGRAMDSLVADGCILSGALAEKSILFSKVHVHSYAKLSESVVLPDVDIARHARLHGVFVGGGGRVPAGLVVGKDPNEDARWFTRTPGGVTLITQAMLDKRAAALARTGRR